MKKIWIVGGIGPTSTLDRYSNIFNGFRQKANDDNSPKIVINSISMAEMLSNVSYENWDALVDLLLDNIKASTGAGLADVDLNTFNILFDEAQKRLTKCKKVVVGGSTGTVLLLL
jgi:aspartate/glutamate racemase